MLAYCLQHNAVCSARWNHTCREKAHAAHAAHAKNVTNNFDTFYTPFARQSASVINEIMMAPWCWCRGGCCCGCRRYLYADARCSSILVDVVEPDVVSLGARRVTWYQALYMQTKSVGSSGVPCVVDGHVLGSLCPRWRESALTAAATNVLSQPFTAVL